MKNQYRGGELLKKGELGQFANLRGCLARKKGVVFLRGGLIPQCTLCGGGLPPIPQQGKPCPMYETRDFEILGWCPAGPVLPNGEKVPL